MALKNVYLKDCRTISGTNDSEVGSGGQPRCSLLENWDQLMKQIVLNIPHAATDIPERYFYQFCSDLQLEMFTLTDWFTDDLFQVDGSHRVVAPVNRILVDTERFSDDSLESMAALGMGCLYSHGPSGQRLRNELSAQEKEELLTRYYDVHHNALVSAVNGCLEANDKCFLVDCHSFPDTPMPHEKDVEPRPDFCLGTTEKNTPADLQDFIQENLKSSGYTVAINHPYQGCLLPSVFDGDARVTAIMIEVNRKLYMDQAAYQECISAKSESFSVVQKQLSDLIGKIATRP